ncbi:MAG: DUF2214 family protein [Pseudomonadota bacterium]|nr:DUF2214 family protein [Pseudomonadota bacterium]
MTAAIVLAWLHYLAFMFMAGAAVSQLFLLKLAPAVETLKTLTRVDRIYGAAAAAVLLSGFARMPLAHGGKGMGYYLHSGAFHGALGLFILAALISIVPTLRFIRWNRLAAAGTLPDSTDCRGTRKLVHVQLGAMAIIALLMPMMARGL